MKPPITDAEIARIKWDVYRGSETHREKLKRRRDARAREKGFPDAEAAQAARADGWVRKRAEAVARDEAARAERDRIAAERKRTANAERQRLADEGTEKLRQASLARRAARASRPWHSPSGRTIEVWK